MFNSNIKLKYFVVPVILTAISLTAFPVLADQVFAYSDDLSSGYNLDMFQTRAKISGGRAFTADDSVSSAVISSVVANSSKAIVSARLDVSDNIPSNTRIVYYISNDNGYRFMQVNPGYTYSFDSVGNQLRWKAIITRESLLVQSASVDSVYLAYTVSDTLAVNQNNVYSNSGYNSNGVLSNGGDINSYVCSALSLVGLGCNAASPATYAKSAQTVIPTSATVTTASSNTSNNSGNNSNLAATIYTAGKKQEGSDLVNLVKVKGQTEIYEIVGGKKHLIPTMDIFYDYGFKVEQIQDITQKQLDKFPRIKLIQITGNKKKTYYFTEGGMIRLIPDKNVSGSYGDRDEDIIIISKKEFNFYPQNQFVFLENPLNRDVFQIIQGKTKRYVTPQAVKRMKIDLEQIAPINQTELAAYKTDKPIVL
ncbi:MAG: hypothetical protein A3I26_03550 [Candidatus Yanofskybacteria bacterium RIFCSPLOWO2_02_FULL_43_10]|nr:MAG: hypothetical protein A2742_01345 [Candidatus Yanofskybacteria bacterium RIFCSPHIGHO2_01_FULL_43_32]OGN11982.1 MAG: hypothetical protein A3C69_02875 [Candidatus Yanofskybacteria bacterium RIFCSPHIGHO2_02_FULL_43_12]OGN17809.1 MAG: hypothetical protein A3E34_01080 [Candidatus Yanofskybacteria bacterium RIFCSPHIGHO2_12_FULL_43_11]OGN24767.1 MAG: hypothetical protein A2923_03035 [Candidatus Yanofskybacteria bacterium RIFCSPLOWO2_01_FULL_43_46]OGN30293.1 MAG: hypothetical protein A3I26_03550